MADHLSSEDHARTRRKRRSSSNGRNQANEPPPVLMRLSELCTNHKKTHDASKNTNTESQLESRGVISRVPPSCEEDLKNLRSILLQVDLYYQNTDAADETTKSFQSEKPTHNITSYDISNLCVFYGAVLSGSFCPHSISLLGRGRDLKEGELNCRIRSALIIVQFLCLTSYFQFINGCLEN